MSDTIIIEEDGERVEVIVYDIDENDRKTYSRAIRSRFPGIVKNPRNFRPTVGFIEFWSEIIPRMTSVDSSDLSSFTMISFSQLVTACSNRIAGKNLDANNSNLTVRDEDSRKGDSDESMFKLSKSSEFDLDLNEDGSVDLSDWQ